tara:strand:+ start:1391 stop:2164 length:774 start_codon:yes stop_codon:yes gene_type:complete
MKFVDTHTHLFAKEFDNDINDVIKNAISNGIEKMLLPNIDSSTTKAMINLCKNYPDNCHPMIGLHPCSVKKENIEEEIEHIEDELKKNSFVAIGEIGIDLYWDKTTLDVQKEAFETQIKIAKEENLPIVIHTRNSFEEAYEIVEKLNDKNLSGVFHCFSGNLNDAKRIIELENFYLGIGGVVTFKNGGINKIINQISLENLILETDSPYLTPVPNRGKRNESMYILDIAKKISEIYKLSIDEVAKITTHNAHNLFKL